MYCIEMGFDFEFIKNKKERVIAYCSKKDSEGCQWCVKASLCRSNGFFFDN